MVLLFFFSSRRRHTRFDCDWSSDVCSSDLFDQVNASRYGLHASVFSRSLNIAFRAVDELEVGGVVVNEVPGFRSDTMPYGGGEGPRVGRRGPRVARQALTPAPVAGIPAWSTPQRL